MRAKFVFTFLIVSMALKPIVALSQVYPTLYVGLVSITPSNGPVLAAADGGYFKKYGLDVRPLVMAGSSTALAAMLSGDVSLITIAGSGLINAYLAGRDAVMIAGLVNVALYELVVSKEISSIEDLKGKKLGIARFGGSADFLARWELEKHGLMPGKDVIILQVGANNERLAALSQGAIQATLLEPVFARAAKKAGYRTLVDYSTAGLDYLHNGIGTTRSFIEKNRDLMTRFMKAMIEGIHRYKTDRAFGLKVMEGHLRVHDADTIQNAYDYNAPKTSTVPYVSLKGMRFLLDTMGESNPGAKKIRPEEIVDNAILQEIEASGFVKKITSVR